MVMTSTISFDHEEGVGFRCTRRGCARYGGEHRAVGRSAIEHVAREVDVPRAGAHLDAFVLVATASDSGPWEVDAQLVNGGLFVCRDDFEAFSRAAAAAYDLAAVLNA